jgi:hypothetical protein
MLSIAMATFIMLNDIYIDCHYAECFGVVLCCIKHITKRGALNKSSFVLKIILQNTNITSELKWKLFTKVIKKLSKEAWVSIDRELN